MRKSPFFLILASLLCAPASADDWLLVSQDGLSKIYLDPASRNAFPDGSVSVRALTDYDPQSAEAAAFKLSEKGLSEIENALFDCAALAYRSGGGRWFDGHMATGAVRSEYPAKAAWSKVPPFYLALSQKVCARP